MASKRIIKAGFSLSTPSPFVAAPLPDFNDCTANAPTGMTVSLASDSDMHKWHVVLQGPAGTVYSGGQFGIVVTIPEGYPFKPPVINFSTRIYHPNVTNDNLGSICLAMLKSDNWKPAFPLRSVLEAVRNLLVEPQPDDPLEARIADEYRNQRPEFERQAKFYVEKYAHGPPSFSGAH